jgi:hypothetical protein
MSQQGQVFELKATGPPDQRGLEELGARYKRCLSPERPNGVDQADLYQHEPEQVAAPVYPREGNAEAARAEALGPRRGVGTTFVFGAWRRSRRPVGTSSRRFCDLSRARFRVEGSIKGSIPIEVGWRSLHGSANRRSRGRRGSFIGSRGSPGDIPNTGPAERTLSPSPIRFLPGWG